jgi:MoxR-like ATPase
MQGRAHLSCDDVAVVAPAVLRHRLILNFDAHADGQTPDSVLTEILRTVARKAAA